MEQTAPHNRMRPRGYDFLAAEFRRQCYFTLDIDELIGYRSIRSPAVQDKYVRSQESVFARLISPLLHRQGVDSGINVSVWSRRKGSEKWSECVGRL